MRKTDTLILGNGDIYFVELCKHMSRYLGHFPGAKQVRNKNELVHINHLYDAEPIIQQALEQPATLDNENDTAPS